MVFYLFPNRILLTSLVNLPQERLSSSRQDIHIFTTHQNSTVLGNGKCRLSPSAFSD